MSASLTVRAISPEDGSFTVGPNVKVYRYYKWGGAEEWRCSAHRGRVACEHIAAVKVMLLKEAQP